MIAMGSTRQDLRLTSIVVAVTFVIIFLMVSAVGNDSVTLNGYSAVLYCAAMCVGIQWAAWIPASIMKTERFYDLIGCLTFLTVVGFSLWAGSQSESPSLRELIGCHLVFTVVKFSFSSYSSKRKRWAIRPTQNITYPISCAMDSSSIMGFPNNDSSDCNQ